MTFQDSISLSISPPARSTRTEFWLFGLSDLSACLCFVKLPVAVELKQLRGTHSTFAGRKSKLTLITFRDPWQQGRRLLFCCYICHWFASFFVVSNLLLFSNMLILILRIPFLSSFLVFVGPSFRVNLAQVVQERYSDVSNLSLLRHRQNCHALHGLIEGLGSLAHSCEGMKRCWGVCECLRGRHGLHCQQGLIDVAVLLACLEESVVVFGGGVVASIL